VPERVQVAAERELVRAAAVPELVLAVAGRALDLAVAGRRLVRVAAETASAIKTSVAVHAAAVHAAAETRSAAGVVVVAGETPLAPVATGAAIAWEAVG
jgi:hypothetical protein